MSNALPIPSLGRTVRNIGRMRTIVSVFARHGFGEILSRTGLSRYLSRPPEEGQAPPPGNMAQRARAAFAELGTTFVKLGQVLSTRPDILPAEFIEEFKTLQDAVPPFGFEEVKRTIEEELGAPLSELYQSFSETPIAAASVAQAHEATLSTGERVIVKVQRPGIDKAIDNDISILHLLADLLERYVPETKVYNPTGIVSEFFRTMRDELDFTHEAHNTEIIAQHSQKDPHIKIPKVFWELTGRKVLTIERLEGFKANRLDEVRAAGIDTREIARVGVRTFLRQVFVDGFFHGDLHAGNIFILGPGLIGLIDFGICGRFDRKTREAVAGLFIALMRQDFVALAQGYCELSDTEERVDIERFAKDLSQAIGPQMGRPLSQLNSAELTLELARVTARHKVKVPRDLLLFFRALVTLEALGRDLDPDFNVLEHGTEFVKVLVKERFKPERIAEDLFRFGADFASLSQDFPGELRLLLRRLNRESIRLEVSLTERKDILATCKAAASRIALGVSFAGAMIAAALLYAGRPGELFPRFVAGTAFVLLGLLVLGLFRSPPR